MNRQWFEEKVFSGEPLNSEERRKMKAFLKANPEQAELFESWQKAEGVLIAAEELAPEPGFANRWQARWKARHKAEEASKTWGLLMISATTAALLAVQLTAGGLPQLPELSTWLVNLADSLASFWAFLRVSIRVLSSFLRPVPPVVWFMLSASSTALVLLWSVALNRLVLSKGATK